MPRFRAKSGVVSGSAPLEFDLCARCAGDGDIIRTVVRDKLGMAVGGSGPLPVDRIAHRSYDFQPRPTPCISCARILSSEDD